MKVDPDSPLCCASYPSDVSFASFLEEILSRDRFIAEQGSFLPDDLCPFVGDQPGRLDVAVGEETLLDLQESVLLEVSFFVFLLASLYHERLLVGRLDNT